MATEIQIKQTMIKNGGVNVYSLAMARRCLSDELVNIIIDLGHFKTQMAKYEVFKGKVNG
jgi:hypothetical protein